MSKMNFTLKCVFFLLPMLFTSIVFSESSFIGVGTELKFHSTASGGIIFSNCTDDENSSCATFTKIEGDTPLYKSKKLCTLKIKNSNVAKLEISKGGSRTLTVKQVTRDGNEVKTLILDGARLPILLSCDGEYTQNGMTNRMGEFPLTKDLLSGFVEFSFGNINLEKAPNPPPKAAPSSQQKVQGGVI